MNKYTLPQLLNIVRSSIKWEASIEPLAYDDWPRLRRIATMDLTILGLPVMKCYIADFGWIAKQKTEYQDVIILRFVEDLPIKEVAHAMEKTEGAVKLMQHRAIKELQRILSAEQNHESF